VYAVFYVGSRAEDSGDGPTLYVSSVLLIWRVEAKPLEIELSPGLVSPPPERNWLVGFFLFEIGSAKFNEFEKSERQKEVQQWPITSIPMFWFRRNGQGRI
jgi:hypothetical protein